MCNAPYLNSVFIFRRDLRVHDNTALNEASRLSKQVLPCFIFDPRQIKPHPYQSKPAMQFMSHSISDLECQFETAFGKLALFYDSPEQVLRGVFEQQHIQAVFINRDYSPFSRSRDIKLADVC